MHYVRRGAGKPLLLLHGIGGSWRSWQTILDGLAVARDVIAVDLPGFGQTPPLVGPVTIAALADAVTAFLEAHDLIGIDAVGSSMGARLVLELARRGGVLGAVVSLDPGGFWKGWEKPVFYRSEALAVRLVRALQPVMPAITRSKVGRTLLLSQYAYYPRRVSPHVALDEMRTFANAPSFDELLTDLVEGRQQQGAPKGTITAPLVIGWGRQDYVCFPYQSTRALAKFPDARLYWFEHCGHYPQWDQPAEATRLILAATGGQRFLDADIAQRTPAYAVNKPRVPKAAAVAGVVALVAGSVWLLVKKKRR
ncbi:alpha/beta fold hydrolase [Hymenobacter coccineus]|uniref:Hydrolase n=1 Tax=Hymenobacter coccineus TaxID=1908235 RepID=A0A1G1THU7_9BACT|nr:alpha/beta fold hydrolase [Hymenobacter coccineus]OGX90461.1 hydrolase [Hymenobacter coccineus]